MDDQGQTGRKPILTGSTSLILPLVSFLLISRAAMTGSPARFTGFSWLPWNLSLGIGIGLLGVHFYLWRWRPMSQSSQTNEPLGLTSLQRYLLQELASHVGEIAEVAVQAKIFAGAILSPSTTRQRITERYEPGQRILRKSVTVELQIPRRQLKFGGKDQSASYVSAKTIFLPIVVPVKGKLHDSFALFDSSGQSVPVLSYAQYLQLVARLLRTLLLKSYKKLKVADLPPQAQEVERIALDCVMYRGVDGALKKVQAISDIRDLVASPDAKPIEPTSFSIFMKLVEKLATNYALVAALHCDADRRLSFRYEYTIIPAMRRNGVGLKDMVRLFLGARPIDINVELSNAWTCQSYHVIVESGDGLFVVKQEILPDLQDYYRGKRYVAGVPPYHRLRKRLGQSYSHFYSRFFPEPSVEERPPRLRLAFREVPPGSTFRAMVAATAAALLIWIISFIISRTPNGEINSDAPAFLLAFPAIAAAWLGFEAPTNRLLEATLVARLSLFATAAASVAASGLYMIYATGLHQYLHGAWSHKASILGITDRYWSILALTAITNAAAMIWVCLLHTWEFRRLASRQRKDQEAIENA